MTPCKVTAHLLSPLAGEPPQLDALVIFQQNRHHRIDRSMPAPPQDKGCIPIVREWVGDWYVSRSSSPILEECVETVDHYNRRTPVEHARLLREDRRLVVPTGNSWTKSYRFPLRVRNVSRVVWFCVCNPAALRHVLFRITNLGKKVSQGYGIVGKWEVEHTKEDWSWFAPADGNRLLMRPIPLEMNAHDVVGGRRDFGACVPPYWHPERYGDIVVPC